MLLSFAEIVKGLLKDPTTNDYNDHEYNYVSQMLDALPPTAIALMELGFASLIFLQKTLYTLM